MQRGTSVRYVWDLDPYLRNKDKKVTHAQSARRRRQKCPDPKRRGRTRKTSQSVALPPSIHPGEGGQVERERLNTASPKRAMQAESKISRSQPILWPCSTYETSSPPKSTHIHERERKKWRSKNSTRQKRWRIIKITISNGRNSW